MLKAIPSAPDYVATPHGTIARATAARGARVGHELRPWLYGKYLAVGLYGGRVKQNVHRLVAEAFHGPCPDGCEVNHKDGDKLNNRPENLEYVTRSQNAKHAFATGLRDCSGENAGRAILTEVQVLAIREAYADGASQRELAAEYGVSRGTIQPAVTGRSWGLPPVVRRAVSVYAPASVKASVGT